MIRDLTLVLALLAGLQGIVRAQDGGADSGEAEPVESSAITPVRTAERAEVKEILRAHKLATKSRDAAAIAAALEGMVALDNKEFFGPAKAAFSYRLSKVDQAWAKEEAAATGFDGDAIEIERLLHRRTELVEIAGARGPTCARRRRRPSCRPRPPSSHGRSAPEAPTGRPGGSGSRPSSALPSTPAAGWSGRRR